MDILTEIGTNKIFVGVAMLIMNMGSRHLLADISPNMESLMKTQLFKKVILFCIVFVATRDIITSLILTFAFSVVVNGILNEKSKYSFYNLLKATII